jgi:hypothetical protein
VNVTSWLLWGFAATVIITIVTEGSQELRLTRVDLPYLLGTMTTSDRSLAKFVGIVMHLMFGWVFSLVYVLVFEAMGHAGFARGALVGAIHAAFVMVVLLPALPGIHPRMASEHAGPTAKKQLEPPGKLGLHYGAATPAVLLLGHVLYGAILGTFYLVR